MTYDVLMGTLNPTHSLTHSLPLLPVSSLMTACGCECVDCGVQAQYVYAHECIKMAIERGVHLAGTMNGRLHSN